MVKHLPVPGHEGAIGLSVCSQPLPSLKQLPQEGVVGNPPSSRTTYSCGFLKISAQVTDWPGLNPTPRRGEDQYCGKTTTKSSRA